MIALFWIWLYRLATKPNFAFARLYAYEATSLAKIVHHCVYVDLPLPTWLLSNTSCETSSSSTFGGFFSCKILY